MKRSVKLTDAEWLVSIITCHYTDRFLWLACADNIPMEPLQSNKSCRSKNAARQSWVRLARKNDYVSWRFEEC